MHAIETYVIRAVTVESIDMAASALEDAGLDDSTRPGRDDVRQALRFDPPIAAAEVLLGPPGRNGRYPLVAGREGMENARAHGREVVLAAIAPNPEALPRAIRRWRVWHAAA